MSADPAALPLSKLKLGEIPGGTVMQLRVKPGSRRNEILGVHGGALKLAVVARPEKGKANKGVIKLLGRLLDVPPTAIEILSGMGSQDKSVLIPIPAQQVLKKLRG